MPLPNKYEITITVSIAVKEVDRESYKVRDLLTIEARNEAVTTSPSSTVDVFKSLMSATDRQAADELGRVVIELRKKDEDRRRADEKGESAQHGQPTIAPPKSSIDVSLPGSDEDILNRL